MGIPGRSADVAKVIREVCAWLRARNEARKLEFQVALENIDPAALGDSVAIVDNQFMLRSFVRDMLKERGWRVSEYDSSTPEFLKGFANSPHDVVLVNLGLPVETQSSIADAVNLSSKFQQPPVVMGYSEESARSQLFLSSLASLMKFSRRESARLLPRQVGQEAD
jgi:PleD family two-component response regulator